MTEKFLIDSNSFITPYKRYYAFDLVPTYWETLSEQTKTKRLILLDMVKQEIEKGNDELKNWIAASQGFAICKHVSPEIIDQYSEVLRYVQHCGLYKPEALRTWSENDVADPWLIAAAAVEGYTIITDEGPSGGLSRKTPNRAAKIPDVAKHFNVKTDNLFYMMRELGIRI